MAPDHPNAVAQVSCGEVARSQWAVIVDPATDAELPDGQVGEIWLHGDNVGLGYWGRQDETELTFRNKVQSRLLHGSHAQGSAEGALWLRTGDLGVYLAGELYITGRIKDLIIVDGRNHYPQDVEATVAEASTVVRAGFVTAFSVPGDGREQVVIVAERAAGSGTRRGGAGPAGGHPRGGVTTPYSAGGGGQTRCSGRDSPDDEWQTGAPGVPSQYLDGRALPGGGGCPRRADTVPV